MKINGLALPFNSFSNRIDSFDEVFLSNSIEFADDVLAFYSHDERELLGRTSTGSLTLDITAMGVEYSLDIPEARTDLIELINRGDLSELSFGFHCLEDEFDLEQERPVRYIKRAVLTEISIVASAAYSATTIQIGA